MWSITDCGQFLLVLNITWEVADSEINSQVKFSKEIKFIADEIETQGTARLYWGPAKEVNAFLSKLELQCLL